MHILKKLLHVFTMKLDCLVRVTVVLNVGFQICLHTSAASPGRRLNNTLTGNSTCCRVKFPIHISNARFTLHQNPLLYQINMGAFGNLKGVLWFLVQGQMTL